MVAHLPLVPFPCPICRRDDVHAVRLGTGELRIESHTVVIPSFPHGPPPAGGLFYAACPTSGAELIERPIDLDRDLLIG